MKRNVDLTVDRDFRNGDKDTDLANVFGTFSPRILADIVKISETDYSVFCARCGRPLPWISRNEELCPYCQELLEIECGSNNKLWWQHRKKHIEL